jgi:Flp pilus assembly protein TadD
MNEELMNSIKESIKAHDYETANDFIAKLFGQEPNSSKPHLYLGIISELKKDRAKAMRHFRAALALDGTDQVVLYNLYRVGDGSKSPIRFE